MPNSRINLLWKLLTAFCGLLSLLFLVLGIRSHYRIDCVRRQWEIALDRPNPADAAARLIDGKGGYWEISSNCGLLLLCRYEIIHTYDERGPAPIALRPLEIHWSYSHSVPMRFNGLTYPWGFAEHNILGVSHFVPSEGMLIGSSFLTVAYSVAKSESVTTAPHWMLALLTAIPVVIAGFRWFRAKRRVRPGLCRQCCYDLRAHHPGDRCPECGTPVPQPPAETASR